jgi:hypothetical protein
MYLDNLCIFCKTIKNILSSIEWCMLKMNVDHQKMQSMSHKKKHYSLWSDYYARMQYIM